MRVRWTELALLDLDSIAEYLTGQSAEVTVSQLRLVQASVRSLSLFPGRGRPGRIEGTRELVVAASPYIVAYRERDGYVEVLAVIHGAKQWPKQF